MTAIEIIFAAKQRCRLIKQRGRNSGKVFRQALDFLIEVRLHQVKDAAGCELVRLCVQAGLREPVGVQIGATTGEFCQRQLKRQHAAEWVGALLQVGITEHQIVMNKPAEYLPA